jgi:pyridoxamine 5'-phosphate oxidase
LPRRPDIAPLRREDLDPDPIAQFAAWSALADEQAPLPEAVTLATVDADGAPDARMVLLKGADEHGLRFFTNYGSAKAAQLGTDERAAVVVYWRELDRQVRFRGTVGRLGEAESDAYFATRPRDSQVGTWASPQSEPLESRERLDRLVREAEERFAGTEVPRPEHWGGYLLCPRTVEFWQGQVGRLHDRFRYTRAGETWTVERLAP